MRVFLLPGKHDVPLAEIYEIDRTHVLFFRGVEKCRGSLASLRDVLDALLYRRQHGADPQLPTGHNDPGFTRGT